MKKLTREEFIKNFIFKHGNIYDYSQSEFSNSNIKIKIICHEHGFFYQTPKAHMVYGCPYCFGNIKLTNDEFIKKSHNIHGNKYDYSLVDYNNNKKKVKIICKEHGVFEQIPSIHLNNHGCPFCYNHNKYSTEEVIKKFKEIHKNKYDYSLDELPLH
jgi:hypothetical protein